MTDAAPTTTPSTSSAAPRPSPIRIPTSTGCGTSAPCAGSPQHGVYMVTGYDEAFAVYTDTGHVLVLQLGHGSVPRVPGPARGAGGRERR